MKPSYKFDEDARRRIERTAPMPKVLETEIRKIIGRMQTLCDDETCTALADSEIESTLKRIEKAIIDRRNSEIYKFLDALKKDSLNGEEIEGIVSRIWDDENIAKDVIAFLQAMKTFKRRVLAMKEESCDIDSEMKEIESFLQEQQQTLKERINTKCQTTRTRVEKAFQKTHDMWKEKKQAYARKVLEGLKHGGVEEAR